MNAAAIILLSGLVALPCGVGLLIFVFRLRLPAAQDARAARGLWEIAVSAVGGVLVVAGAGLTVGGAALLDL